MADMGYEREAARPEENLKGEPEAYAKAFAGELGNDKRPGYNEPLSVGVGQGELSSFFLRRR